ncbi:MAG: hypothetical protein RL477_378 [Pseudomonadota bacterium]|jgi:predicted nucleotidyltransferase
MTQDRNETERLAAADFARAVADLWRERLGADLLGIYMIGSLAHGGFSARYSDIDLAVIAERGLDGAGLAALGTDAAKVSERLAAKLSIFWTDRGFARGRFPPLDRIDLMERAVTVIERERIRPARPTLAEVRGYLAGPPFARWAERARQFIAAGALDPAERKPYMRALLYPARFCYSWLTGDIASNDDAVAFLESDPRHGLDLGLIGRALACRRENRAPDGLFSGRAVLEGQIAAAARLMAENP